MIKPTIGRVVWYWESEGQVQPYAAQIAFVWEDDLVNLGYLDANGLGYSAPSTLLWDGEGERPKAPFAEWMPYQKGQAQKTEELQKVVDDELGKTSELKPI